MRRHLKHSGVPSKLQREWGSDSTSERALYEALEMADRHVVYKQCLKEVAEQMELCVTFMAKFASDRAGSSCHIHLSLWRDGVNAFAGGDDFGPVKCSDVFRWFLGGWIARAPDVMVFYAPTVNSYKRYVDASWAPTRLAWSYDNRTAGFRAVGEGQSLRIECRIPGADCNPYLAFAASLASGLEASPTRRNRRVFRRRHLRRAPPAARAVYAGRGGRQVAVSEFAKRAFGEDVVEHYGHFFRTDRRPLIQPSRIGSVNATLKGSDDLLEYRPKRFSTRARPVHHASTLCQEPYEIKR